MKIRTKAYISLGILAILVFTIMSLAVIGSGQLHDKQQQQQVLGSIEKDAFQLSLLENDYILHGGERPVEQWKEQSADLAAELGALSVRDPAEQAIYSRLLADQADLNASFSSYVALSRDTSPAPADRQKQKEFILDLLSIQTESLASDSRQLGVMVSDDTIALQTRNGLLIISLLGLFTIFLCLNYFVFSRTVLRSLVSMDDGMKRIESGDFDTPIRIATDDELGEMAATFNGMASRLSFTLSSLKNINNEMILEIKERKRIEEELRESEIRFREQYQNNPLAIFTWQYRDGDFVLIDCNRAAEVITEGRSRALTGSPASRLYADRPEVISEVMKKCYSEHGVISGESVSEHFLPGKIVHITAAFAPPDLIMVHMEDITERRHAEEALRESESRINSILRGAPVGIGITSGRIIQRVNNEVTRMVGYAEDELIGKSSRLIYATEEEFDYVGSSFSALPEASGPAPLEVRWKKKDGTMIDVLLSSTPIDPSDRSHGITFVALDITDRKRAEEALRESEERNRTYIDNSPEGIFIVDAAGRYRDVNPKGCSMLGYSREELLRLSIADLIRSDSVAGGLSASFLDLRKTGSVATEAVLLKKDGGVLPVFLNAVKLPGDRFLGFCTDMAAWKRAEAALAESEERYRVLFESANDAIFLHEILPDGRPGKYIMVNDVACRRLGYSREDLLKMTPLDLRSPNSPSKISEIMVNVERDGHTTFEAIQQRKDGTMFPVEISTTRFTIAGRAVAISIARDITDRKHVESALANARKKLDVLSTITTQDIQSAAFSLSAYLNLAKKENVIEPVRDYLEKGSSLVQDIVQSLNFARDYQDLAMKPPRWQNFEEAFIYAISHLKFLGISHEVSLDGLEIFADAQLEKALYHLMQNTVLHGERVTEVRIGYEKADGGIWIIIRDNGVGISRKEQELIFERGYGKGPGLGLFLVREILSITGMIIRESGAEGTGAQFEIFVPDGAYRFQPLKQN